MTEAPVPIAVLAGGLATRLGPAALSVPKSLIEVEGEPFIAHQLRLLRRQGLTRVLLCVGHLGELIREAVGDGSSYGLRTEFVFDGPSPLGTAGAVKNALPLLAEVFYVLYGDAYLPCDFGAALAAHRDSGRLALMTVFRNDDRWDRSNVEYLGGQIRSYDRRSPSSLRRYIDYGLGVFRRQAFEFVPSGRAYDLGSLYRTLIEHGELAAHEVGERFYEIGSPAGLEEFRSYLAGSRSGG
jgi:MurNAc alpha-1-phosphate uridylyltransferase